jgi:carbonic anhydrase
LLERLYALAGYRDIAIKNHADFSNRFYLRGENARAIKTLFTDELVLFFESNAYYHIESSKDGLLVFSKERIASIKEIKALLDFGVRLNAIINKV